MFSITTPIYYVNDDPHLGTAYTTILADALARYHRLKGEEVFFLTGVDEHGQKVYNAVRKNNIADPQAYVDDMARRFTAAWAALEISYDDFLRTTEPRHKRVVTSVLQQLWDAGEIYRGEYEGWYCVPDERFWTEKDLVLREDGTPTCPDCLRPVERIVESNYFFRMSRYQDWLVATIQEHPDFILPAYRRNEVLGFLRKPLGDLCISRPVARMGWGIPLPFDPSYVTYVWFDALLNYVTAAGYLQDEARFQATWPHTLHLVGKDILTTHSVYWPAMLKAAGLPLPRGLFAHGWWTVNGQKMSKSLGNVIRPLEMAEQYGADAFRYLLLREMTPGLDADFDTARVAARYTNDLANNLGNLLQRVTSMAARYLDGRLPGVQGRDAEDLFGAEEEALRAQIEVLPEAVFAQVEAFQVHTALSLVMDGLAAVNGYLERAAPWAQAKQGSLARVGVILSTAAEALRLSALLLLPVLPQKAAETCRRLGWALPEDLSHGLRWGCLAPGSRVEVGEPLFPRKE
jgi:methionyl-tRNA synthetase